MAPDGGPHAVGLPAAANGGRAANIRGNLARGRGSPAQPGRDTGPAARRGSAGCRMSRMDSVDWWRAGYDAGVRAAYRAQQEQAGFDAVLLELVAVLASMCCPACGDELPPDSGRCDACTIRARRDDRTGRLAA